MLKGKLRNKLPSELLNFSVPVTTVVTLFPTQIPYCLTSRGYVEIDR